MDKLYQNIEKRMIYESSWSRNEKMLEWYEYCRSKHEGQINPLSNEPYILHILRITNLVDKEMNSGRGFNNIVCAAMGIELVDSANVEISEILKSALKIMNDPYHAYETVRIIRDVSLFYTGDEIRSYDSSRLNFLEIKRLSKISYDSISVQWAKIICRSEEISKQKSKVYQEELKEMYNLLKICRDGNFELYSKALIYVVSAIDVLGSITYRS